MCSKDTFLGVVRGLDVVNLGIDQSFFQIRILQTSIVLYKMIKFWMLYEEYEVLYAWLQSSDMANISETP